jgi:hypothetical protein
MTDKTECQHQWYTYNGFTACDFCQEIKEDEDGEE